MDAFIFHLRELVSINNQLLTELDKDEPSTALMRESFDERGVHTEEMSKLVPDIDKTAISEADKATLQNLFKEFNQQAQTIQDTLGHIVDDSRDKLADAVKRRKAEEGYRSLIS